MNTTKEWAIARAMAEYFLDDPTDDFAVWDSVMAYEDIPDGDCETGIRRVTMETVVMRIGIDVKGKQIFLRMAPVKDRTFMAVRNLHPDTVDCPECGQAAWKDQLKSYSPDQESK